MHISTDRYFRDRKRHDLALRMIRHEARTCTIRSCTSLTDDRIRRLCRTFAQQQRDATLRRRRGKAPRQVAFFTRNARMQFETSLLASVFITFGLLRAVHAAAAQEPSIEYGDLFCDAYEAHLQLIASARIGFEHAWFLLHLLTRSGSSLRLMRCRYCGGRYVRDGLNVVRRACPICELKAAARSQIAFRFEAGAP